MSTEEKLYREIKFLNEPQKQTLLMLIHTWNNPLEDTYDEDGNVIIDAFYQSLLDDADPDDEGVAYTEEEIRKKLGL